MRVESQHVAIVAKKHDRSQIAILALHAGAIEPMTGEIATAIAGCRHRLYCFVGRSPVDNLRLHVTSTQFDEPKLRSILRGAKTALAIHGSADYARAVTLVGGTNGRLAERIGLALDRAGFSIAEAPQHLSARSPDNLVNRVPFGGVQLEPTRRLRDELGHQELFHHQPTFERYAMAIGQVLDGELPLLA